MSSVSMIDGHIDREERKFIDKEIIQALECCKTTNVDSCKCCSFNTKNSNCINELCKNALDLINRQQVDIEEWKKINQRLYDQMEERRKEDLGIAKGYARIEAIKEFAERLKDYGTLPDLPWDIWKTFADSIDNLVKEMVGNE